MIVIIRNMWYNYKWEHSQTHNVMACPAFLYCSMRIPLDTIWKKNVVNALKKNYNLRRRKLSGKRIRFDVDEARRTVAAMRQLLRDFNMAMDKMEREIRAVPSWWQGDSLIPFMKLANEILAEREKIAGVIQFYIDGMELAIREKLEDERVGIEMVEAAFNWRHDTPLLRAANMTDINDADKSPEPAPMFDVSGFWRNDPFHEWRGSWQEWLAGSEQRKHDLEEAQALLMREHRSVIAGAGTIETIVYDWELITEWLQTDPSLLTAAQIDALAAVLHSMNCIRDIRRFLDAGDDGTGTAWTATMEAVSRRVTREIESNALAIAESGLYLSVYDSAERLQFVLYYELTYPDRRAMLNEFLEPLWDAGLHEDILNIMFIIYRSPEPYNSLIFKYLPEISITDIFDGGVQRYEGANRTMYVDFTDLSNSHYRTFFHELGHAIDHAMAGGSGWASNDLFETLEKEVFDHIESTVREFVTDEDDIAAIMAAFRHCGNPDNLTEAQRQDFDNVVDNYLMDQGFRHGLGPQGTASMVFGGFTDLRIRSDADGELRGRGHGRYLRSRPDLLTWYNSDGNPTGAQNCEFFADVFSTNVRGNSAAAEQDSNYFPNATREMEEIIRNDLEG